MTDGEILYEAIHKAIDGGWKVPVNKNSAGVRRLIKDNSIFDIIFNHDFAKALWGYTTDYTVVNMPYPDTPPRAYLYQNGYKYHLQQMVLDESPIKYLGENI